MAQKVILKKKTLVYIRNIKKENSFIHTILIFYRQSMNMLEETVPTMVKERKSGIIDARECNKLDYCEKNVYLFGEI